MSLALTALDVATAAGPPDRWDAGGPPFPFVLVPLFWLVLLAVVVTTVVLLRRRRDTLAPVLDGERALARRYAAGEIDAEEFRARRGVLREK